MFRGSWIALKESLFQIVDKAVEVFLRLRGKTYNRLASIVVMAGAVLIAEPLWVPYVQAYLEQKMELQIPDFQSGFVGFFLISIGLTYHYFQSKLERGQLTFSNADQREHDGIILDNLKAIISYDFIRDFVANLDADHSYYLDDSRICRNAVRFLNSTENCFLDSDMKENAKLLADTISKLLAFCSVSFFVYPNVQANTSNFRLCMFPDLNCDRGGSGDLDEMKRYNEFSSTLEELISSVESQLATFVLCTKKTIGSRSL